MHITISEDIRQRWYQMKLRGKFTSDADFLMHLLSHEELCPYRITEPDAMDFCKVEIKSEITPITSPLPSSSYEQQTIQSLLPPETKISVVRSFKRPKKMRKLVKGELRVGHKMTVIPLSTSKAFFSAEKVPLVPKVNTPVVVLRRLKPSVINKINLRNMGILSNVSILDDPSLRVSSNLVTRTGLNVLCRRKIKPKRSANLNSALHIQCSEFKLEHSGHSPLVTENLDSGKVQDIGVINSRKRKRKKRKDASFVINSFCDDSSINFDSSGTLVPEELVIPTNQEEPAAILLSDPVLCEMSSGTEPSKTVQQLVTTVPEAPHINKYAGVGPQKYVCDFCGAKYRVKQAFNWHVNKHKGIKMKKYVCDNCGKEFNRSSTLSTHKAEVHRTKDSPVFKCSFCDKIYPRMCTLRNHIRWYHENVRNVKCDVCGAIFQRNFDLKEHTYIHTGEKPHACQICGQAFRQNGSFSKHMINVHGIRKRDTTNWMVIKQANGRGEGTTAFYPI